MQAVNEMLFMNVQCKRMGDSVERAMTQMTQNKNSQMTKSAEVFATHNVLPCKL